MHSENKRVSVVERAKGATSPPAWFGPERGCCPGLTLPGEVPRGDSGQRRTAQPGTVVGSRDREGSGHGRHDGARRCGQTTRRAIRRHRSREGGGRHSWQGSGPAHSAEPAPIVSTSAWWSRSARSRVVPWLSVEPGHDVRVVCEPPAPLCEAPVCTLRLRVEPGAGGQGADPG